MVLEAVLSAVSYSLKPFSSIYASVQSRFSTRWRRHLAESHLFRSIAYAADSLYFIRQANFFHEEAAFVHKKALVCVDGRSLFAHLLANNMSLD